MRAASLRPVFLFILILGLTCARWAVGDAAKIDPEAELITEVLLSDRTQLAEGFVIYPDGDDWLYPISELSDHIGLAIHFNGETKKLAGFILQEERKFELFLGEECKAFYDDVWKEFDCNDIVVGKEDVFVRKALIEKWLPINIVTNSLRAQVVIVPREKLPTQLSRDREAELIRSMGYDSNYDPGYPIQPISHSVLSFPFTDIQLALNRRNGSENEFRHNLQFTGEFFESEANATLSGSEKKLDGGRLRLARREPNGLGAFGLNEVQFFDVVLPQLPLITQGKEARGFVASTFPLNAPTNFESTDLEGPLAPGWEVVLYRNNVLIDRRISDGTGRYRFQGVRLSYGQNLLRLAFYGPRGERREETKNYNISPDLLQPGRADYRVGFGILEDTRQRVSAQYSQNLFRYFTTTVGFLSDRGPSENHAFVGLTGLNPLFLFSTTCAMSDRGGKACEWGQLFTVGNVNLSAKYTRLFDYHSDIFNSTFLSGTLTQESEISTLLTHPVPLEPPLAANWEFVRKNFTDGSTQSSFKNILTFSDESFGLNNTFGYEFGNSNRFAGTWEVSYIPSYFRANLGGEYSLLDLTALKTEFQFLADGDFSVTSKFRYQLDSRLADVSLSATKFFDPLALGVATAYRTSGDFSVGLTFAMGFSQDPRTHDMHATYRAVTQTGTATIRVFLDLNHDGIWEPGEPPVPGVLFFVNPRRLEGRTDERGFAYISNLDPYQPADLTISLKDFEDPYIRPSKPGVRFIPRPGKCAEIDIPMMYVGEIDGVVTHRDEGPLRRVPLQVLDKEQNILYRLKTDSDGFYLFEGIPSGTYWVRVSPSYLREKHLNVNPKIKEVSISNTGSFESGQDFVLVPSAEPNILGGP